MNRPKRWSSSYRAPSLPPQSSRENAKACSEQLKLSLAPFKWHLAQEGTTFNEILDRLRCPRAHRARHPIGLLIFSASLISDFLVSRCGVRSPINIALSTAETDRAFADGGHSLDFINKAFECLDVIGWEHAADVLPSVSAKWRQLGALRNGQRGASPSTSATSS